MTGASYAAGRTIALCTRCGGQYPSNDGWAWVCYACGPDAAAESIAGVAQQILNALTPDIKYSTCPTDGCLLLPGETCPACRARDQALGAHYRRYHYTDTEHDPKRPVAWRPNGRGIQVPVYESEVA
jgi:hypothetical protein